MKKRWFALAVVVASTTTLLILLYLMGRDSLGISRPVLAAPLAAPPTVTGVDPTFAPNDLDTPIVITGTGFTAGAAVLLDSTSLDDVGWVSSTTLTATVPWGLEPGPGVYTLTVVNPGGEQGSLPNAFTVTQGIDVWTTGGPYGGEIWDVALHPVTPTRVYASAEFSGLFFSADSTAHWQLMALASPIMPGRLSFDAENREVIYFGFTGGGAPLRTQDGGSTWEHITLPHPWLHEFNLVAHPITSGVVYATAFERISSPVDPGEEGGLYRSEDRGNSWVTITTGLTDTHVTAIAFHPDSPNLMLAGTRHGHIFRSDNGGDAWNWVARPSSYIERLHFNPFGAHEAWATTASQEWGGGSPFRSVGGDLSTWQPITGAFQAYSLVFHPTVSGTLWASGGSGHLSIDGGQTWSPLGSGPPGDVMDFAVDPDNPNVMYAGTRHYGVFKSTDGGNTWAEANQGLAGVVPDYLAVSPDNPYEVYAYAHSMGLLKSTNGGGSWRSLDMLVNGGGLAVDPFTTTRVYLGEKWPFPGHPPGGEGFPGVQISEDGGQTWHVVTFTLPSELDGWSGETRAVAPHPLTPGRVLAGVNFLPSEGTYTRPPLGGIYASDDSGEHWAQIELGRPISGVTELVYDPTDPQVIYAGTGGTGLLRSDDGGQQWETISSLQWSEQQNILAVAIHPQNPDTIYVSESGSAYVSNNTGQTWADLQLPLYVHRLVFAPTEPPILYAVGNGGAYRSPDGQTWEAVPGVPSEADVLSLAAGKDRNEERAVVYIGTSAEAVSSEASAGSDMAQAGPVDTLLGAGVYRMTTRLNQRVYLPVLFKGYAP